jgi:hypothetical protein
MNFDGRGSWQEIHGARVFAGQRASDRKQSATDMMRFVMRLAVFHDISARGAIPRGEI